MVDDDMTRGTRAEPGDPTADGTTTGYVSSEPATDALTGLATIVPTWSASEFVSLPDPGYQIGELIGRGGMGEVIAAHDQRIGRDVAVKRIRSQAPSPDVVMRFLREARIQARLDHPAIVPVYELGTDGEGKPYFTMKRLAGTTMARLLADGIQQQRLLRAFVDVCLAVQFAHKRGVIHRDLKPSNIMLGDYGEVYVLDWGIARVLTDRRRGTQPGIATEDVIDEGTTAGAMLGTPGYMSPEQIKGHEIGPPTDVYSLGAILFEILAGEPLHPRGEAALATTLTSPQAAPAQRANERPIPPELDSACYDALASEPRERPSARTLADRVQAYLDGDRDLELRRTMATTELAAARRALESSVDEARPTALRRAGRALALDPSSREAAELVTELIVKPPDKLPPALTASLENEESEMLRDRSRSAMWAYASVFLFWAMIPFLDVINWPLLLAFYGLVGLLVASSFQTMRTGTRSLVTVFALNGAALLVFSRIASVFVLTPIVTMGIMLWFTASPKMLARRWIVFAWLVVVVNGPLVGEWLGLLPSTWHIDMVGLHTRSDFFVLHGLVGDIALIGANFGFILISASFAMVANGQRHAAQRQLHIQHWHLRHLLPGTASGRRTMQG
jgi:serine/threonine-protein kinase